MIFLGLVALLFVGVHFALASAAGAGRRQRSGLVAKRSQTSANVAVLIAAHNRDDRIVGALNSATRVVPLSNVFLVSDGSSDRTAELAREYGVEVVETFARQGWASAIESGIRSFRLLDEFGFVLLLEVDTRLDPHHLERVLPLFDDDTVAAVDVRVDTDWKGHGRSPVGALLTGYRARDYALTERHARARWLPSVARTYRASALAEIEINPPGLAAADFDLTMQVYRRQLGRIELCPDVTARTAAPTRLGDFHRQTSHWSTGFWQAIHRHGLRHDLATKAVVADRLLTSVLFALLPLAALATFLLPEAGFAAAGLVLGDYLITLTKRRHLGRGLLYPLVRIVAAVGILRTLASRGRPAPAWLDLSQRPKDAPQPKPPPPRWRGATAKAAGWVLVAAAAAVTVVRVARTTSTLPATAIEPGLVDSAYGRVSGLGAPQVDGSLVITDLHLRMYTTVTSAFGRHGSVLGAARELSIAAVVLLLVGLVLAAAVLRVRPLVIAMVVGMIAVSGPVITLLAPVGPGGIAAAWLAVAVAATVAAIGRRDFRWISVGAVALLVALPTAPVTIVPIGVAAAGWFAFSAGHLNRWLRAATALAILAVSSAVIWWGGFLPQPAGLLSDDQRTLLIGLIAVAAIGGLVVAWLRPVAAGIGAGAGFAAMVGPRADVLLPALVLAAVLLVAMLVEDAAGWQRPGWQVFLRRATAGLAAVAAVAAAVTGLPLTPPVRAQPDHAALATWVATQVDKGVMLVAPPGLWSEFGRDLGRQGLPPGTVRRAGDPKPAELLIAMAADRPPGVRIAEFDGIAVMFTGSDAGYQINATRVKAGRELAENTRLTASDGVREALRAGRVDLRAMATIAAICQDHVVELVATGLPAHERGSPMPHRVLLLSEVDGQPVDGSDGLPEGLLAWLRAQEPPFAPTDIKITPRGVQVGWRLPARLDLPPLEQNRK
jgi:hypothetical protein